VPVTVAELVCGPGDVPIAAKTSATLPPAAIIKFPSPLLPTSRRWPMVQLDPEPVIVAMPEEKTLAPMLAPLAPVETAPPDCTVSAPVPLPPTSGPVLVHVEPAPVPVALQNELEALPMCARGASDGTEPPLLIVIAPPPDAPTKRSDEPV